MPDPLDTVRDLVEHVVEANDAALYDLVHQSGVLRVLVERPDGIDLDAIAELSRAVSRALDEADPISGRYTLEVSSPGLERPLRTAEHFRRAVGEQVTVRLKAPIDGTRRFNGVLVEADDEIIRVEPADGGEPTSLPLADVQKARTIFVWERDGTRSDSKPSKQKRKAKT